ncbi:hypothetical protein ACYCVF_36625 [Bradyrhizobium sp. 1.29L]
MTFLTRPGLADLAASATIKLPPRSSERLSFGLQYCPPVKFASRLTNACIRRQLNALVESLMAAFPHQDPPNVPAFGLQ